MLFAFVKTQLLAIKIYESFLSTKSITNVLQITSKLNTIFWLIVTAYSQKILFLYDAIECIDIVFHESLGEKLYLNIVTLFDRINVIIRIVIYERQYRINITLKWTIETKGFTRKYFTLIHVSTFKV